ncbi:MAG TPA: hypothetical protein VMU94_17315 [Streptosporangiaceae bacterium]|nr:hypothetical protein [Streptosporangiaceae bacterium]
MLRLRPLRPGDETAFRAGHDAMAAEDFTFGLGLEPGVTWTEYLRTLADHRAGLNLPDHLVPSTFLVADVDGQVIGRVSIRHELNEYLRTRGGHVSARGRELAGAPPEPSHDHGGTRFAPARECSRSARRTLLRSGPASRSM